MSLAVHLRASLASLYSLAPSPLSSDQAHDFLMNFQSRNVQRKLKSLQQRQLDRKGQRSDEESPVIDWGSSWMACLQVLLSPDAHATERLFCAQTLMHRLRRIKLAEAIDWEVESQPGVFTEETVSSYQEWIAHHVPPLATLTVASNNEEELKGQTSLLMLAYIAVHHAGSDWPLLSTLGASMAAIVLRLRYTSKSVAQGQPASANPMVNTILQSLQSVGGDASLALCASLGSIPDTLLASPGGARGKLSMDPRCVAAAVTELRHPPTGVQPVWQALSSSSCCNNPASILWTCERWAKYLPLPWEEFCEPSLQLARHSMGNAMPYLVGLFEAASWTTEQILSVSLGLSEQQDQSNKKRKSSKSKKRHNQLLQESSTDSKRNESLAEFQHRGEIACKTVAAVWQDMQPLLSTPEGVACLCACANSCLPHWVRHPSTAPNDLVESILTAFQQVCLHPDRNMRSQTYEPLCNLHTAMMQVEQCSLEHAMVQHLFQSSMRLATSCGYPSNYFHGSMTLDNDEEMEVDRNDVRDVLRAVSGGEDSYSGPPRSSSLRVLDGLVRTCVDSILNQQDEHGLPHETAVHALSALAKPLNILAEAYARNELASPESMDMLTTTCQGFSFVAEKLIQALPQLEVWQSFPVCRLFNLGIASLCPAFACILRRNHVLTTELNQTLKSVMRAAALSIVHIPELAAESTLEHSMYDIRGAFRSPGGEDHVGVLVFMRLAGVSDDLTRYSVLLGHDNGATMLQDLCHLHDQLKKIEIERGPIIEHGKGVTKRTRRLLLDGICRYTELAKSTPGLPEGVCGKAETELQGLFHDAVLSIARANTQGMDASVLFSICEVAFDIAAFPSSVVSQLFGASGEPLAKDCLSVIMQAGLFGYQHPLMHGGPNETLAQWGRLRGALMTLIQGSCNPDLSEVALHAIVELTKAECDAIVVQCQAGCSSNSSIFNDEVISTETLPAGAFLMILTERVEQCKELPLSYLRTVAEISGPILHALTHVCPPPSSPSVVDARATLCEAWFRLMCSVLDHTKSGVGTSEQLSLRNRVIAETLCATILLILYPEDPTKPSDTVGMSMGGPQTLALMDFFENTFSIGAESLHEIARTLPSRFQIDMPGTDPTLQGMAIVGAILFRAISGGLPPWAIERIPATYAALFNGCGKDVEVFGQVLRASMYIRLTAAVASVKPGSCIAGRFFEAMKENAQQEFLQKATEIAVTDTAEAWKRYKTLLKQASGGKKKASGFQLKPSPTSWDCDRL